MTTVYGYDGNGYTTGDRIELHPGLDMWMRGARYGVVKSISLTPADRVRVELDVQPSRLFAGAAESFKRIAD